VPEGQSKTRAITKCIPIREKRLQSEKKKPVSELKVSIFPSVLFGMCAKITKLNIRYKRSHNFVYICQFVDDAWINLES
jgi:hypothetical protein